MGNWWAAGRDRAGGGMNRLLAGRLSIHWVHGWVWDAVSAFANTGYAPVAYVRGSYCYVPILLQKSVDGFCEE